MKKLLCLVFLALLCREGLSLLCYTCSIGEQDTDQSCVDDVDKVTKTNCNKKYCTVIRQEYKDPKNKVASIFRGCEDKPQNMNTVIEDETYRIYYTACQTDLCNGGSGKGSSDDTGGGSLGDKSLIYAKGIGNKSTSIAVYTSVMSLLILIIHLL